MAARQRKQKESRAGIAPNFEQARAQLERARRELMFFVPGIRLSHEANLTEMQDIEVMLTNKILERERDRDHLAFQAAEVRSWLTMFAAFLSAAASIAAILWTVMHTK